MLQAPTVGIMMQPADVPVRRGVVPGGVVPGSGKTVVGGLVKAAHGRAMPSQLINLLSTAKSQVLLIVMPFVASLPYLIWRRSRRRRSGRT